MVQSSAPRGGFPFLPEALTSGHAQLLLRCTQVGILDFGAVEKCLGLAL